MPGLSLRFAPPYRLRLAYAGEVWVLDPTHRVHHGAEVSPRARWF